MMSAVVKAEGEGMCRWAMRRAEERHAENAAEEPRPAPMGRLAETVRVTLKLGSVK